MPLSHLMWRSPHADHPEVVAEAYYDSDSGKYLVVVMRGTERRERRFTASFDPIFGIDVADLYEIQNVATLLADELVGEKEEIR